ncbi:flagellar hook-basal body complex protein FliE [Alteribacillus iranensis]|uniref:Flagellar hook-basal body complex protein FliE n=2 Tax=Alteribacillus iranensis TaxID=930128 RepID=A0A1I2A5U1_9BACI|nr:flagellar hook-basal body complex protein FliE [Alteribacillus iranensis]SFE39089.1 flagellar hook-basal body complex protein FliE [Alteribacillus iranensis]
MDSSLINNTYMNPIQPKQEASVSKSPAEVQADFKKVFTEAIHRVNEAQHESDQMTQKLVTGEVENLHDVMISAEKASVLLQTTIEVRNKALEAYQEMMRMQV